MRFPERAPAQNIFQGITLLVQIAGLIGTGWLMWSRSILPRLAFETPDRLIVQAFGYALLACGASISITAILYLALVRSWNNEVLPLALRTSATAIWFGPATNIGPLPAALLVCLSVSLFTLLLLLAGLASVRAGGPFASARGVLRYFFRPERRRAPQSTVYLQPPPENDGSIPNIGYPGVILRPEVEPRTTLVAPPPTWIRKPGPPNAALPAEIPFSGEYWLFRPPNVRPPQRSYFRRVSPLTQSFTSVDHTTLRMEAHQKLGHEIDLSCCSAIQIALSNGDRYPGSVSLELVLADLTEERSRSLVLGTAEVASWPRSGGEPVPEALNFAVPSRASLTRFNEITVIFHFNLVRDDRSARIAIERFVLIPRS